MARPILSEFGPERSMGGSRMTGLSRPHQRDVMGYMPPKGPTNIGESKSPGLHGDNCTNQGSQNYGYEKKESSGRPGLGGSNRPAGSQGRR